MMIANAQRQGGTPLCKSSRLRDSINVNAGNRLQPVDQSAKQASFVRHCRSIRGRQGISPCGYGGITAPPQFRNVFHGGADARDQFVNLRSGLPAFWQLLCAGADFVRTEILQMLALSVESAQMRTKKLIRWANQEIAAYRLHVDQAVWRV